jgi:hypothetical protein
VPEDRGQTGAGFKRAVPDRDDYVNGRSCHILCSIIAGSQKLFFNNPFRLFKNSQIVATAESPAGGVAALRRTKGLSRTAARWLFFNNLFRM